MGCSLKTSSVDKNSAMPNNIAMDKKEIYRLLDAISTQAQQVRELIAASTTAAEKQAIEEVSKDICPYCKESTKNERTVRGTHVRCHKKINRAINSLEISDIQAVRRGWMLESDKGGRRYAEDQPIPKAAATKATSRTKKKGARSRKS